MGIGLTENYARGWSIRPPSSEEKVSGLTGGIPESIFLGDKSRGEVDGLSGETRLEYEFSQDQILFEDIVDSDIKFSAYMEKDTINLLINNKGYRNDPSAKHPDIYPRILLARALKYFECMGFVIDNLVGCWDSHEFTENYDDYMKYLSRLGHKPTDDDKKNAAFSTWTGQRALEFGFSEIKSIKETSYPMFENVRVIFSKPEQQAIR